MKLSHIVLLAASLSLGAVQTTWAGKIVVNNDEWTLADGLAPFGNGGFVTLPVDTENFALNVASFFANGGTGNFLVHSSNFGLVQPSLAAAMTGAGHGWTVSTAAVDLATLQSYDAVFLAGAFTPATQDLIDYVEDGGNVYLAAGTGNFPSAAHEAAAWNDFLNHFGLAYASSYNGVGWGGQYGFLQPVPVVSSHPLFAGVSHLIFGHGNSVSDLDPADSAQQVVASAGSNGLIAVYEGETTISVTVDVKPGSDENPLNLKSKGVIPVAILSTDDFDATTVDGSTVVFAGASPAHGSGHLEDVDGDGDTDWIGHFPTQDTNIADGDSEAGLTGQTIDGQDIEGSDAISTRPKKGRGKLATGAEAASWGAIKRLSK